MDDLEVQGQDIGDSDGDDSQNASRGMAMVALGVGVLGLILGGLGSYLAYSTGQEFSAYKAEVASRPDPVESVEAKLSDMDERLVNVGAELVRGNNSARQTNSQLQRAISDLGNEVRNNRTQINKNTVTLSQIAEGGRPLSRPSTSQATTTPSNDRSVSSNEEAEPETSPSAGNGNQPAAASVHTIGPGDSFWRLAKQYHVTIDAIKSANPDVDPGRLQVGQKVRIPSSN